MPREDEVRIIAYNLWQEDGCCDGRDVEHWVRAETIWLEQQASNPDIAGKKRQKKAAPVPPAKAAPQGAARARRKTAKKT